MDWKTHRARVAAATRWDNLDVAQQARVQLREARAEARIRELLAQAPPLTAEQRNRLAAILAAPPVAGAGGE